MQKMSLISTPYFIQIKNANGLFSVNTSPDTILKPETNA